MPRMWTPWRLSTNLTGVDSLPPYTTPTPPTPPSPFPALYPNPERPAVTKCPNMPVKIEYIDTHTNTTTTINGFLCCCFLLLLLLLFFGVVVVMVVFCFVCVCCCCCCWWWWWWWCFLSTEKEELMYLDSDMEACSVKTLSTETSSAKPERYRTGKSFRETQPNSHRMNTKGFRWNVRLCHEHLVWEMRLKECRLNLSLNAVSNVMATLTKSSLPWVPHTWMSGTNLLKTPRALFWGTHKWAVSRTAGNVLVFGPPLHRGIELRPLRQSSWDGYSVCNGLFWGERWWSVGVVAADGVRPGLGCILQSCGERWFSFYYR